MKKLPIGIQTFVEIRQDDYIYVDKTKEAYELITNYKYAFLSRPRRFGKSLFVDTLRCIFEGRKELFEGLYIYDKWDWNDKYPVIHISFAGDLKTPQTLKEYIISRLTKNLNRLELNDLCKDTNYSIYFKNLIEQAYEKYQKRIVILIDEYDKPILDNVEEIDICKQNREILKSLYSIIKDSDEYIKFTFLTGVSKFSKTSIFSGLNMLEDISLNPDFGNICGYTQHDLDTSFAELLEGANKEKVKKWYNGYNFLKDKLYNPFDILQFIRNKFTFRNYWFASGTPTFLIKYIENYQHFLPNFSDIVLDEKLLDSYDIDNMNFNVLLFQSGYLTIDELRWNSRGFMELKLKIPNYEVQISLFDYLLENITPIQQYERLDLQEKFIQALKNQNIELLHDVLKNIYSDVPYTMSEKISNYEGYYSSVFYCYLQSLGFDVIAEDISNIGRIDLTVKIDKLVYIFEFKVKDEDALEQIKIKKYYEKYLQKADAIYIVGINFDKVNRNIKEFKWEKIK